MFGKLLGKRIKATVEFTPRRRTPRCPMTRWLPECKIAVANQLVGCILPWLRMPKWKSSIISFIDLVLSRAGWGSYL